MTAFLRRLLPPDPSEFLAVKTAISHRDGAGDSAERQHEQQSTGTASSNSSDSSESGGNTAMGGGNTPTVMEISPVGERQAAAAQRRKVWDGEPPSPSAGEPSPVQNVASGLLGSPTGPTDRDFPAGTSSEKRSAERCSGSDLVEHTKHAPPDLRCDDVKQSPQLQHAMSVHPKTAEHACPGSDVHDIQDIATGLLSLRDSDIRRDRAVVRDNSEGQEATVGPGPGSSTELLFIAASSSVYFGKLANTAQKFNAVSKLLEKLASGTTLCTEEDREFLRAAAEMSELSDISANLTAIAYGVNTSINIRAAIGYLSSMTNQNLWPSMANAKSWTSKLDSEDPIYDPQPPLKLPKITAPITGTPEFDQLYGELMEIVAARKKVPFMGKPPNYTKEEYLEVAKTDGELMLKFLKQARQHREEKQGTVYSY